MLKSVKARTLHWTNGLALLPGQPDFLANIGARERSRRDDKDEVLQLLRPECVFDLAPPVAPAFERHDVLPDREVFLFKP